MPIHDWTRVDAGLFHDFHQDWTIQLCRTLNHGRLPPGFTALINPWIDGPIPDGLTLHRTPINPGIRFADESAEAAYARRANHISIQRRDGQSVAVLRIVSPGNKHDRNALKDFVGEAVNLLWQGIHLLVIDLFPPSERDPQSIHKAIWDEWDEQPFKLPADKPLTVVAYEAGPMKAAYVEPVAVGDDLPAMPIFLMEAHYIEAPLEETYRASWAAYPADLKELLEPPAA